MSEGKDQSVLESDVPPEGKWDIVFQRALDARVKLSLEKLKRQGRWRTARSRWARARFERRLGRRWRRAIDLFDLTLDDALRVGTEFNRKHRPQAAKDRDLVFDVLARLHARACLVASEVRALIVRGHASGANARWRTLHEIAVIAFFVKEHGQEVAERYLLHQGIESGKAAEEYQRVVDRLGYKPLSEDDLLRIKRIREDLLARFGASFDEPYGWAAAALDKKNLRFVDLERAVNMDHMRGHYRMASHGVHGQPKGIYFDIGRIGSDEVLLAGPSDAGLTDPADGALLSLVQCTIALLSTRWDLPGLVAARVLERLRGEAGAAFLSIQKKQTQPIRGQCEDDTQ